MAGAVTSVVVLSSIAGMVVAVVVLVWLFGRWWTGVSSW